MLSQAGGSAQEGQQGSPAAGKILENGAALGPAEGMGTLGMQEGAGKSTGHIS